MKRMTKKKSKRLLCLVLALTLVFAFNITPAFAFTDAAAVAGSEVTDDGTDDTTELNTTSVTTSGSVASIGDTTYETLAEAFAAATSGNTIKLLSDVTVSNATYNGSGLYQASSDITLDLNEYSLTVDTTRVFGVLDGGSLTVKNGTVSIASGTSASATQFVILRGTCSFTAENVTFDSNSVSGNFIQTASGCEATIALTDCTITNVTTTVVYDADGKSGVTLTDCSYSVVPVVCPTTLEDYSYTIVLNEELASGNYEECGTLYFDYVVNNGGSIDVSAITLNSKYGASLTVNESGTVKGAVTVASGTSMTVNGGTVEGSVKSAGTFTMTSGTVSGSGSQVVYVTGGSVAISGGEIKNTAESGNARGLVFETDATVSGTITGGMFTGVDIALIARSSVNNSVTISGGTYTATKGINLVANILANNYGVYDTAGTELSSSGNYYISSLDDKTVVVDIASSARVASVTSDETTTYYLTLADAVATATSGDTVTLLADTTLTEDLTISTSITLALGDYTINTGGYVTYISNNATVSITADDGGIKNIATATGKTVAGYHTVLYVYSGSTLNITGGTYSTCTAYLLVISGTATIENADLVSTLDQTQTNAGYSNSAALVQVSGSSAELTFISGSLNAGTSEGDAADLYGIYLANGGTVILGEKDGDDENLVIDSANAAISMNNTTSYPACTITIYSGTYTVHKGSSSQEQFVCVLYLSGDCDVNISGGTFANKASSSSYSSASSYNTSYNHIISIPYSNTATSVTITGGTFTTDSDAEVFYIGTSTASGSGTSTIALSGGTYSTAVAAEYCADGYVPTSSTDEETGLTTYGVTEFYLGVSSDSSKSVSASIASGYGTSTLYVGVSASDISNYSTTAYPTMGLTYTDDDGEEHTYIFAGWYSYSDDTYSAMEDFPESTEAYAKFVDADVLTVKCIVSSVNSAIRWRFMTSLDTLYYKAVGFTVTDSSDNEVTLSKTSISKTSLTVTSVSPSIKTLATDFSSASTRVATAYFDDADNTTSVTYTVTPYWTTGDGTTVTGETASFTYTGNVGALTADGTETEAAE
ncbi:MAG: hypothetical protein LUG98_11250 [Tannerellaceae bacterium]|nr:hypothetical protein [Tannerellaceae bacterium]